MNRIFKQRKSGWEQRLILLTKFLFLGVASFFLIASEHSDCEDSGSFRCSVRNPSIQWFDNIAVVVSPRRTRILTNKPLIMWQDTGAPYRYRINCNGRRIATGRSETNELQSPLLPSGYCQVSIVPSRGLPSNRQDALLGGVGFIVPMEGERGRVRLEAERSKNKVEYYRENGYYLEALRLLKKLPPSPQINLQIAQIYADYIVLPPESLHYASLVPNSQRAREIIEWAESTGITTESPLERSSPNAPGID